MRQSEIEILICEDDKSLGPAMAQALEKVGYKTTLVANGNQALSHLKSGSFLCYIIDCMLPDQKGVDLAKSVRLTCGSTPEIIMTSGIFKDKNYIANAIQSVEAIGFLKKPFNIEHLIKTVDNCFTDRIQQSSSPLQSFIDQPKNLYLYICPNNKLHGLELPLFLTSAVECQFSGFVELESKDNDIKGKIYLHEGHIFTVESNDKKSLFGHLLVEHGFMTKDEVEKNIKNDQNKPLGQQLVESNFLSPHSIHIIMTKQMEARISYLIQNVTYSVNLKTEEYLPSDISISQEDFYPILSKWITTRLNSEWLQSHLSSLSNHSIVDVQPSPQNKDNPILNELKNLSQTEGPFSKALESLKGHEVESQHELYSIILSRNIHLKPSEIKKQKYDLQIKRLKELITLFKDQNYYERLQVNQSTPKEEMNDQYFKMVQLLNHKGAPQDAPRELFELSRQLISLLDEAQQTLTHEGLRAQYNGTLADKNPATKGTDLNLGYIALMAGKYEKAFDIFKNMPPTSDNREQWAIYSLWAEVKSNNHPDETFGKRMKKSIGQIPIPYDPKRNAHYHFVKGLCHKANKEYHRAKECFEHTQMIDPNLPALQRELRRIHVLIKEEGNPATLITNIVSSLIGRKKSS